MSNIVLTIALSDDGRELFFYDSGGLMVKRGHVLDIFKLDPVHLIREMVDTEERRRWIERANFGD